MDFNDLALRIEGMYETVNRNIDVDIRKHVKFDEGGVIDGVQYKFKISFTNGRDEVQTTNMVFELNAHIANLKDQLKNKLGDRKKLVEEKVDQSIDLQLVIDLANAFKHVYPLDRERSNRSPRLINISNSLVVPPGEGIGFNFTKGELFDVGDNCIIQATADVVDREGEFICHWSSMVKNAVRDWEDFINTHGLAEK